MTNYEKNKELLDKYSVCTAEWGATKENEIKICIEELKCINCIFKTLDKSCAMARLEWLDEEYKEKVGFKDDALFLLSIEEYKKYKNVIPKCNTHWWLRSPGDNDKTVACVNDSGEVNNLGNYVNFDAIGIRPALKIDTYGYNIGDVIIYNRRPYTVIDSDLFIATIPIDYDMFDTESNDYETSHIRKKLKNQ